MTGKIRIIRIRSNLKKLTEGTVLNSLKNKYLHFFFSSYFFRSSKGIKIQANSKAYEQEASRSPNDSQSAPAGQNSSAQLQTQLQTIAHAVTNKNPVRVEMLTNLSVSKEVCVEI